MTNFYYGCVLRTNLTTGTSMKIKWLLNGNDLELIIINLHCRGRGARENGLA
jgi:hypothetical protein